VIKSSGVAILNNEITEKLGLRSSSDSAFVDARKTIVWLIQNGIFPDERRLGLLFTGDGKNTGRKMKSVGLGVQCLNLGKGVAQLRNYHVLAAIRGGEQFENLKDRLDALEDEILGLLCPCSYDAPCGDDCEHCLRVEGKPYCIKALWGSDWKFMQLLSGADAPSSNGEYCHFCLDRRANRRNVEETCNCLTVADRFTYSKKPRIMTKLFKTPLLLITDELHVRLRICGVLVEGLEAEVFRRNGLEEAKTLIRDSMVATGITHFTWFTKKGAQVR
jgi:hypothetical protein